MKLAILTQYYPPEVGAPQTRLSDLASNVIKRGHSVTVVTGMPNYPTGKILSGYRGVLLKREQRDGVNVIRTLIYPTQRPTFIPRLTNYFSFVGSSAILGSLLLDRPDYLLVESPPLFLGLGGWWLSWLKSARLIFNVSDLWPESAVNLGVLNEHGLAHRLSAALEAFCYRKAWLVTGQSKGILASINTRFPNVNTFHLSNGVDTQRFDSRRQTHAARRILGGDGPCIALYVGLHGLAQGLEQVLAAAELLAPKGEFRFVFVGDGPEKKQLRAQAERAGLSNVFFLDARASSEIPELLASADVLLVPLKRDIPGAVPSKLYEAMASGRPVVLVADGEAAKIVQTHQVGVAVAPGNIAGIAKALESLQAEPQMCSRLGENGRHAAEEHFDRGKIAGRFIDYLEAQLT